MARRVWLTRGLALSSGVLLPCLSACESPPTSIDKLTIGHAYHASFGLLYVADLAGFFKDEELEVEFKRYSFGRDALQDVLKGKLEIATPYDTPVALAILNDEPIRVLSSLSVLTGNSQVVCNKLRGIRTPADLKGRHIGFIPNTISEYILSLILADAGIDERQVVHLPVNTPEELSQAMIRGDVDGIAIWPPFTHSIAEAMGGDSLVQFTSPAYIETAMLATTEIALKENRREIKKLMTALIKAQDLSIRDPDRALKYIQKSLPETRADIVAATWSSMQPQIRVDNRLLIALEGQISWHRKRLHKETEFPPDVRPHLADEILRSVQPQAVTIPKFQASR